MPSDALASTVSGMIRLLLILLIVPRALWAETVTVFAAASLKTALEEIAEGFETDTDHQVTLSFAGSSALARQIEFGAPVDVFISANTAWMTYLEDRGLIDPASRFDLAGNGLVLITNDAGLAWSPDAPLPPGRIAMALVDAVPAGIYGKQALQHFDLWDGAQDRVVQTDSVRAALALVALGQVPLGIVYRSDAMADERVSVLTDFPANSHSPIRYPVASVGASSPAVQAFLDWLKTPNARDALTRTGFKAAP